MMSNRSNHRARLRNRRGAMLVFVAVAMLGLLGMLALALDVGAGSRQRRIAQTAADAAAIGGGTQILRNNGAEVVNAAYWSALMNGFPASEVSVDYPPSTGPYAFDLNYVEVRITKPVATIFGRVFNIASLDVRARAVAGLAGFSNYCVQGLSGSGIAIDIPGDFDATDCSVISNSSIAVRKLWATTIGAVGTVSGVQSGTVRTGIPPMVDPLSSLQVPPETVCDYTGFTVSGTQTLNPGVYCGGIDLGKNNRANLNPGTYILRGGGINGTENGSELSGTEVTIINTNGPGNDVSAFRPLRFGNACFVGLTAPTSGPYKGIVIFADRAGPSTGPNSINEMCGKGPGAPADIVGVIYMPTQSFGLGNSNGKLTIAGAIVANIITGQNGGGRYTVIGDATAGVKRLSLVQ